MERVHRLIATLLIITVAGCATAATPEVEIATTDLGGGIYMLTGQGGNIGVSVGDDGVFLIDDQFAPLTEAIRAAIAKLSDGPVRYVINTHWHGDHTGGNENLGKAGATIVAHENVRQRLSVDQLITPTRRSVARPDEALPVITFNDAVTFHINGGPAHVFHLPNAHTDGDSMVHFPEANVLHMGDTFFNRRYPFIDLDTGGSLDGYIAAVEKGLQIADAGTKIIPGHGPLADRKQLEAFHTLLTDSRDRVAALIAEGKNLAAIQAAAPLADYDDEWAWNFISPKAWLATVHRALSED